MPITVFPSGTWEEVTSSIRFIMTSDEVEESRLPISKRILGCTYTFRLGWVPLTVIDHTDGTRSLSEREVLAKLLMDVQDRPAGASLLSHIVLGMAEGAFEGRTLSVRHDRNENAREAWLEER